MRSPLWPLFTFILALLCLIWAFNPDYVASALLFLGVWFTILLWVLLVAIVGALLVVAYIAYTRVQDRQNRPVDGAYPLQRFRLRGGRTVLINPTHMASAAAIIDRRTGQYTDIEPSAGWDRMLPLRHAIERSNSIRAMFPGDQARMNANGAMSRMPSASGLRQLDAKPTPPPRVVGTPPVDERREPAAPPVALLDAVRTNDRASYAIGQDTQTGEIVRWDASQYPHARFHGASQGSGKTNAAKTALAGMALQGAHVVILDRRRFKDFRDFDGNAELLDTSDPRVFVAALQRLEAIYRERDRLLGAHGAANIDELPQRLVRYVVMVTEFGTLCSVADGEGVLRDAMRPLANIMREAGAAGIHLLFEDQVVEKGAWPRGVAANAGGVFTGYLPLNMGAAGGYHHAHQLSKYHFHHDGHILRTWDTRPAMRKLLATAPAYDARLAVLDGVATPAGDGERSEGGSMGGYSGEPVNAAPVNEPTNDDASRWDDVVMAFFAANPDALTGPARGVSDLARMMAEAEGNIKSYENYKGIAHKAFHGFRAAVRLPSGAPLGVDTSASRA